MEQSKPDKFDILIRELKKIGYEPKRNQDKFFAAIYDFLHSDKKYLVARGGMGLGKTISTAINIKNSQNIFSKFFIATPFAKTKDSWADDFNSLKMRYAVWLSKTSCIKHYHSDVSDCNDECIHRKHLEKNGEYSDECKQVFENLLKNLPTTPDEYYLKFKDKDCLWPVVKLGLKDECINVGDYFPTFNSGMMNNIVYRNSSKEKSVFVYDEAHRLPDRLKEYFSRKINIEMRINGLEKESTHIKGPLYIELCYYIQILKKWYKKIKSILSKSDDNQELYSFSEFLSFFKPGEYERFREILDYLIRAVVTNNEPFKDEDEMKNCEIWNNFLSYWESISVDASYQGFIQVVQKYEEEDIIIEIKCIDISDKAPAIWSGVGKVIFMSGTIDETFVDELGIDKNDVTFTEKIDSFSIKDDCIIYAKGSFCSGERYKTIKEYEEQILEMVNTMNGRIIFFIPAMSFAKEVEKIILKTNRPVFNTCYRSQSQKSKIIEDFVDSKDGVLLFGMRQGIDGENLVSEEAIVEVEASSKAAKKYAVENAIVLGYPYRTPNKVFKKQLDIEEIKITKAFPNYATPRRDARRIIEYFPISREIHQAVTRLKRNDHDVPCIILFAKEFAHKEENMCLDSDLSSHKEYEFPNILEFIKKQNLKRLEVKNGKDKK